MMEGKKLSLGTRLGFGVCDLGGNLFFTIMGFYLLNFMTDVAKLGAGLAGHRDAHRQGLRRHHRSHRRLPL